MFALSWLLSLAAFSPSIAWTAPSAREAAVAAPARREIAWQELAPSDQIMTVDDMIGEIDHFGGPAEPVRRDARAVAAMHGMTGTLTGYVVPIATDGQRRIVELFLVPYYGACIHVPPPPANQIVHIRPRRPLPAGEPWDAYRATGTLRIAKTANETATAIYAMDLDGLEPLGDTRDARLRWLVDGVIVLTFLGFLFAVRAIARWHPQTMRAKS